jgi:hypothetical protein
MAHLSQNTLAQSTHTHLHTPHSHSTHYTLFNGEEGGEGGRGRGRGKKKKRREGEKREREKKERRKRKGRGERKERRPQTAKSAINASRAVGTEKNNSKRSVDHLCLQGFMPHKPNSTNH